MNSAAAEFRLHNCKICPVNVGHDLLKKKLNTAFYIKKKYYIV